MVGPIADILQAGIVCFFMIAEAGQEGQVKAARGIFNFYEDCGMPFLPSACFSMCAILAWQQTQYRTQWNPMSDLSLATATSSAGAPEGLKQRCTSLLSNIAMSRDEVRLFSQHKKRIVPWVSACWQWSLLRCHSFQGARYAVVAFCRGPYSRSVQYMLFPRWFECHLFGSHCCLKGTCIEALF